MSQQIRVSLNKVAEFTYASSKRRETIAHQHKHKVPFIAAGYQKAEEFLPQYFGNQMDAQLLQNKIAQLVGLNSITPKDSYNKGINGLTHLQYMKSFQLEDITFQPLPMNSQDGLIFGNVFVNIRPDCLILQETKQGLRVGALKLHFPVTNPLGQKAGKCVAALLFEYLSQMKNLDGTAKHSLCYSLDVPADQTYQASKDYKLLMKEVVASCKIYEAMWNSMP